MSKTETTLNPLTEAQWDAMTRKERVAFCMSHYPSDEAVAWGMAHAEMIKGMSDAKQSETTRDALELLSALGLTYHQASVGVGSGEWFVIIYEKRKKPAIVKWKGWPVRYNIGGGIPKAFGASA